MHKSLIVAAALLLAPAVSQAKTLEDLLVEKGVITRAEAKGAAGSSAAKMYWNQGTRFEFPDSGFTSGIATYLLERYTFTDNDEQFGKKNTSSFEQRRARVTVSGTALDNEFAYLLQGDFVGESRNGENVPSLKDAFVTWNPCDWSNIKMGQYKTFISRQYMTADYFQQFPDPSAATNYFNLGRQQGVSTQMWSDDKMFDVRAGIFNGLSTGEGINRPGLDTNMVGMVMARVNPTGNFNAFQETDIDWSENLGTSFGAAYAYSENNISTGTGAGVVTDKVDSQRVSVDASMKWVGFSANAEYYYGSENPTGESETVDTNGFYVQAGYFLMPKKFEVAARYSYIDCDNGEGSGTCAGQDQVNETTVALNYYFWKHYLKASLAYVGLNRDGFSDSEEGNDENQNRWLFQVSSYF